MSICKVCGGEFKSRRGKIYCSATCREKYYSLHKHPITTGKVKIRRVLVCKRCGDEFIQNHHNQKYCGPVCKRRSHLSSQSIRIPNTVEKACAKCGKIFKDPNGTKLFCHQCNDGHSAGMLQKTIRAEIKRIMSTHTQAPQPQPNWNNFCPLCGHKLKRGGR
jgi:hypothetical protein